MSKVIKFNVKLLVDGKEQLVTAAGKILYGGHPSRLGSLAGAWSHFYGYPICPILTTPGRGGHAFWYR